MDQDKKEASPREMGRLLQGIGILLIGIAALIYALKSFPKDPYAKYMQEMFQNRDHVSKNDAINYWFHGPTENQSANAR